MPSQWGGTGQNDAVGASHASYALGVTSIDTAPIYGQGLSEEIVGEALKRLPRDKVQILTKFGMRWDLAQGDFGFKTQENAGHGQPSAYPKINLRIERSCRTQ